MHAGNKHGQGRHLESQGSLRQAFSRMGAMIDEDEAELKRAKKEQLRKIIMVLPWIAMIDKFHDELPTSTKVMLDILAVLLVIFVAAKVKQAGAEALHSPYHIQDVSEQEQ